MTRREPSRSFGSRELPPDEDARGSRDPMLLTPAAPANDPLAPEALLSSATPNASPRPAARSVVLLQLFGALLWLGLVTWKLPIVPGMSMDEAWFIVSARGEWPRVNPLSGMTSYTGPFPVLLLQLFGKGAGVVVLRGASALAHTLLLLVLAAMLRKLYAARTLAGWALPLIATCPAWLVQIRTGIEVTMFTAPLAVLGLYLLGRGQRWSSFAGGLAWGLLIYNHLLGLWAVLAITAARLVVYGPPRSLARSPALLGFALGLAPRLLGVILYDNAQITGMAATISPAAAFADLLSLPEALWEMLIGRAVYLRYVGRIAQNIRPYWSLALLMFIPWLRCWRAVPRHASFTLLAVALFCVLTTLGAPHIEVRYFVLAAVGFPVGLVMLGAGAIEQDARWALPIRAAATLLVLGNVYYVMANFYLPWQRRELAVTAYHLGQRSPPIGSWHFLPKEGLVQELSKLLPGPEQIIAHPSLQRPLRALMGNTGIRVVTPAEADKLLPSVFVDYRSPRARPRYCVRARNGNMCFTRPQVVDQHFVLYPRKG